jgi:hypothetical protein
MGNVKFLNGFSKNLPNEKIDGYMYFTRDNNYFYIDYLNENNELVRTKISAEYADKLRYLLNGEIKEISAAEVDAKAQVQIVTWGEND